MLNIPNEIATEKINELTKAYLQLSSAMSSGVLNGKSTQNAVANIEKATGIGNMSKYTNGATYVGQNRALLDDLTKSGQELGIYGEAVKIAQNNLDKIKKDSKVTQEDIKAAEDALNTAMESFINK